MPSYRYKARNSEGSLSEGITDSRSKEAVADQLGSQGLIPVFIEEQQPPLIEPDFFAKLTHIKSQDLILFSRQMATLINAGIPIIQSLTTIEKQTGNPRLKKAITDIRQDLESGMALSAALEKHPGIFSKLYVSMIQAGETGGILDNILNRLALLNEQEAETRARVKAAVRYPILVITAICAAFAFLVTFVIPKFAAVFAQFKTELPFPTRVLININYVVQHYWFFILGGIALIVGGVIWYVRTEKGRWTWDLVKLKLPVLGILFQKVALSRFSRIVGALQKSGVSMMLTLEIASYTVGNVVIARAVDSMRDSLREGKGLHGPMEASGMFPPLIVQMMAVGEETGDIDLMLNKVADYYDVDVEYMLKTLSTMIEPVLLVFIGGMVLFLALGIFLPMWNLMNLFK
ncbi:MAG: type II secretion system F family protein [Nitrospirota bacterium]